MRNKPSKKKTLLGFLWNLFEHENIELIILGVASLVVSIYGHAIYTNHSQIQTEFDKLAQDVRDLSYTNEDLYNDCHNKLDRNEILTDINILRTKFYTLIDQYTGMGHLLSKETYCAIHQYTAWNDQLADLGESVCMTQLKSEPEIEQWRNQMLNQIYKNKELRQGPISSLKEYFTNIETKKYNADQCQ